MTARRRQLAIASVGVAIVANAGVMTITHAAAPELPRDPVVRAGRSRRRDRPHGRPERRPERIPRRGRA